MDQDIKYIEAKTPSSPNRHNNSTKSFNSPDSITLPTGASSKSPVSRQRLTHLENELSKVLAIVNDLLEERDKNKNKIEDLSRQVEELKEENTTIRAQLDHLSHRANCEPTENDDVDALSVSALCARIRERCEQFDEQISNGATALTSHNSVRVDSHHVHFGSPDSTLAKNSHKDGKFNFDQFTPYVVIESEVSDNSCSTTTVAGEEATEILPLDRSIDPSFEKSKTSTPSLGERLKTYAKKMVTRSSSANSSTFEPKYFYMGDTLEPPSSRRSSVEANNSKSSLDGHNSTFTKR